MKLTIGTAMNPSTPIKLLALLTGLLLTPLANAQIEIGIYGGQSFIDDGDLNLNQGKTNLNFSGVSWKDKSFEEPSFYGVRASYWFDSMPNWGVSVDFAHLKNYLQYDKNAQISGTDRTGAAVDGVLPISDYIEDFNMSHGVNTLTFNGQYRWFPTGHRDSTLLGRMQLYTGLGFGFSIPHVEAKINGVQTYEYQAGAGPVVNGMMGVNYDIYGPLSGFGEYKLTYVDVEDDLTGGGTISTETVNHQLIFGLALHF